MELVRRWTKEALFANEDAIAADQAQPGIERRIAMVSDRHPETVNTIEAQDDVNGDSAVAAQQFGQ